MCNLYTTPSAAEIERTWEVAAPDQGPLWDEFVAPRRIGVFIRSGSKGQGRALVVGPWGLIPWFAKEPKLAYSTNNARSEELVSKASYKLPWARGQRCIIPASTFDEPCWETGKNVWWRFARADGQPWGLAGLWNTWTHPATGEVFESYTMLTINADDHPIMRRMHKSDPKLPADRQDKRSVIAVELADVDRWLHGSQQEALALLRAPLLEVVDGSPVHP